MLLLYIVIFLFLLMFLFAWVFFRKAFHRPPTKDLTDKEALITSEWFSYTPLVEPALDWFQEQAWETIDTTGAGSCPLKALWLPKKNAKACLVLLHGYGALPQNMSVVARWAAKQGYSLLIPYERAHGASGGEYCTRDMPAAGEVTRADKSAMDGLLDPATRYDLGVTLSSEGGVPLLICRRADDTFVLRELDEAQFVSLLVERSNPVLDMAALPAPGEQIERPAGEGWSGAVILTAPSE